MIESSPRINQSLASGTPHSRLKAVLVLLAALFAFIGSDKYFTFLDDETTIVSLARQPVSETIRLFSTGLGQHEHPPLSDILLHFWLPMGGYAPWVLRLPSVMFYLTGLFILALASRRLAGPKAFTYTIYIGVLSPFAFHFARVAGWYSFCFLLVAAMTLAYLRYLEKPDWKRLASFVVIALLLVYSNYYGWALVGCLALDVCFRNTSEPKRFLMAVVGTLIVAYAPLWGVFVREVLDGTQRGGVQPMMSRILNALYCFYSLLVSESVAPWFWIVSVPLSFAIVLILVATMMLLSKQNRAFLIYFALLFGGMSVLGIIGTKRLLFISGWLLLSFSIALASRKMKRLRVLLAGSLAFVAAVGWVGVFARKYYAAPHFVEPWAEIAEEAATSVQNGELVISNNLTFRFYVNYALRNRGGLTGNFSPGWVEDPRIAGVEQWPDFRARASSSVFFVNGIEFVVSDQTEQVEKWLRANCMTVSIRELVPDSGYLLKTRFFNSSGQQRMRISLEHYDCPVVEHSISVH